MFDCKRDGLGSVNHFTPREDCTVHYKDLDYAIQAYLKVCKQGDGDTVITAEERNTSRPALESRWRSKFEQHKRSKKMIFAGKSDLKSAFRLLGLSPQSWPWLVMRAQDPTNGKWNYFIDKCLPFGASISCAHFQCFSNALCFLFEFETNTQGWVTNYLDDFLFLALTLWRCNKLIQHFLDLCSELNIPVSMDKTEWGQLRIIFLGILMDGLNFTLGIPIEKRDRAVHMLQTLLNKKKATVKELQSLCGFLNFIGRAIFPGRTFTRCMYAKFANVIKVDVTLNCDRQAMAYKLKQHHHIRLDSEFKEDSKVWLQFLTGKLQKIVNRPMVDLLVSPVTTSDEICFYSDASGSKLLGFGCLLNDQWIQGYWGDFVKQVDPSIEFLELFALTAGLITWEDEPELKNSRVVIFCDNKAVVDMINSMSSKCKHCMTLLRLIALSGLQFNRRVSAKYVDTKSNFLADALSRGQWSRFRKLGPQMKQFPSAISDKVWPIWKTWINN